MLQAGDNIIAKKDIYLSGGQVIKQGTTGYVYNNTDLGEGRKQIVFSSGVFAYLSEEHVNITNKINKLNTMSQITEKFALALTKEPMKTFRKLGITNGDDILTDDGMKIFLSWLLNKKFAEEFKTDVADDMLKDQESSNK